MASFDFDCLVIGAGPGGYVAAIRASQLGMSCALIEKDKPGGVCLNIGCIPSKALIHQAEVFSHGAELEKMGIKLDRSGFEYSSVFKKSRKAADSLSRGVQSLIKKNKIEYITGEAKVTGPNEVTVESKKITGKNILIATGSRPRELPGFEFDEKTVLSSTGVLMLEELPKDLIVLGAGVIGLEFAHVMSLFGVKVRVVEMLPRALALEDAEVVEVLVKDFKRRGVEIMTDTKATKLEKTKSGVKLSVENSDGKKTLEAEKILVAVGRVPNTENLGLEAVGVKLEKGFVRVGNYYRTDVKSIYAVGDVVPSPPLAHVASKEGEIVVEYIAAQSAANATDQKKAHAVETKIDPDLIPSAVYTEPQLASFGPTEATAKEKKLAYKKAVFPYRGAGKSVAIEQPDGIVKILYDEKTHEIIAAHVVGNAATELIHELLLAKKAELLPEDIATMIHAHPTLSEAVMEAARVADGWAIHI